MTTKPTFTPDEELSDQEHRHLLVALHRSRALQKAMQALLDCRRSEIEELRREVDLKTAVLERRTAEIVELRKELDAFRSRARARSE